MDPYRRRTVDVPEERFDSLEAKMKGIGEALGRTSTANQLIAKKETKTQNSLDTFAAKHDKVIVISMEISKDVMKQTKLKYGGCGLEISETASNTLSVGDRIIEVTGENVVNNDINTWHEMRRWMTMDGWSGWRDNTG